jgi:YHS domain-containing protein
VLSPLPGRLRARTSSQRLRGRFPPTPSACSSTLQPSQLTGAAYFVGLANRPDLQAKVEMSEPPTPRAGLRSRTTRSEDVRQGATAPDTMAMVTDPVCGMRIDTDDAVATAEHEEKTYYFCSRACHDAFVADPASYAA